MIWGLSGCLEIASLRDAGVRSFSLTPDCRAEGLHPFGSLSGVIEIQPLRGCLTQIGHWNITIRNHLRRICLYINVYAIKRKPHRAGLIPVHCTIRQLLCFRFTDDRFGFKVMLGCCYISLWWVGGRIVDFDSCPFGIQAKAPD